MKSFLFFVLFLVAIYQVTCLDNSECKKNRQGANSGDFLCDYACATNGYYPNFSFDKKDEVFPGFPVFKTFVNHRPVTLNGMSSYQFEQYNDAGYISRNWKESEFINYADNVELLKDTPPVIDLCPRFDYKCCRKRVPDKECYCTNGCNIYNPSIFRIGSGNQFSAGNNGATGQNVVNPRILKVWTEDFEVDSSLLKWAVVTVNEPSNFGEYCWVEDNQDKGLMEVASHPSYPIKERGEDSCEIKREDFSSDCQEEFCLDKKFKPSLGAQSKGARDCLCFGEEKGLWTKKAVKYLIVGYAKPENACKEEEKRDLRLIDTDTKCENELGDVEIHFAWTPVGRHQAFGCTSEDQTEPPKKTTTLADKPDEPEP